MDGFCFLWRFVWQNFCLAVEVRQGTVAADDRGPARNIGRRNLRPGTEHWTRTIAVWQGTLDANIRIGRGQG